jgi:2-polyprenyl-3-methyl-5-hydroxy-6-metoxy-1,4-benzoquinol methylase
MTTYYYSDSAAGHHHAYLLPTVLELLGSPKRIFEAGCGNGATAAVLQTHGHHVTGIDASEEGIACANQAYPLLALHQASVYDDLAARFGRFPVVLSLEVVEHLFEPRRFANSVFDLLEPGGTVIVSTPYHGYWKNLALALSGKLDAHLDPLWDYGHIKFWSMRSLGALLSEAGFEHIEFRRVGRVPPLAKSMIAIARKPAGAS